MSTRNLRLPNLNKGSTPTHSQHFQQEGGLSKSLSLAAVRTKRKQVEESEQLLNNRVLILKIEEQKLKKSTKEQKNRTATMLKHRLEREEAQRTFQELMQKMRENAQKSYEEKRRKVQEMHQHNHEERDFLKSQYLDHVKSEKAENYRKLLELRSNTLEENRRKKETVKYQQQLAEQHLHDYRKRKLDFFAQERERLIKEEERIIKQKERQIKKLSKAEDKLINAVDENHTKVKRAQDDFEDLNHQATEDFINAHAEYLKMVSPDGRDKSMYSAKSATSSHRGKKGGFMTAKSQEGNPSSTFGREIGHRSKGDSKPELMENGEGEERRHSGSEGGSRNIDSKKQLDMEND